MTQPKQSRLAESSSKVKIILPIPLRLSSILSFSFTHRNCLVNDVQKDHIKCCVIRLR